jgi:DNA-directed RNA polymerase subunit RPC12/RpoP
MDLKWNNHNRLESKSYICGHCGQSLSSDIGYTATDNRTSRRSYIYICHSCTKPTFFGSDGSQVPGKVFGNNVKGIKDETVISLYNEARKCISTNSFTAAVLSCRKLLMHIAVDKGAKKNLKFIQYVEYLADKNIIPNGSGDWVDIIRNKSNEANHEIIIMDESDAKDLINFTEMLLKIVYEFPAEVKKRKPKEEGNKEE